MSEALEKWGPAVEIMRGYKVKGDDSAVLELYGALQQANERIAELTEALKAERAYHRNNTGENAKRRKEAMAALPKKWNKQ